MSLLFYHVFGSTFRYYLQQLNDIHITASQEWIYVRSVASLSGYHSSLALP